jgi:hypothetical protein
MGSGDGNRWKPGDALALAAIGLGLAACYLDGDETIGGGGGKADGIAPASVYYTSASSVERLGSDLRLVDPPVEEVLAGDLRPTSSR